MFRVVPVDLYLNNFGSDRSHMKDKKGNWQAPPPPYSPIGAGQHNNLSQYLRFDQESLRDDNDSIYGRIFSKQALAGADFSTFP